MKPMLLMVIMVAMISGGVLFKIKHEVMALERSIKHMNQQLHQTKERLTLLKAEWSYLTHPGRIHKLVSKYLPKAMPLNKGKVLVVPSRDQDSAVVSAPHSAPDRM